MKINPRAGELAIASDLVNVPKLIAAYYEKQPDPDFPAQRVVFGTSGHRGYSFTTTFDEWHIFAMTQAISLYRKRQGIDGLCSLESTPMRCRSPRWKANQAFASAPPATMQPEVQETQ